MRTIVSKVHFLGNKVHFVESNRDKPAYCVASSCFYVINCVCVLSVIVDLSRNVSLAEILSTSKEKVIGT